MYYEQFRSQAFFKNTVFRDPSVWLGIEHAPRLLIARKGWQASFFDVDTVSTRSLSYCAIKVVIVAWVEQKFLKNGHIAGEDRSRPPSLLANISIQKTSAPTPNPHTKPFRRLRKSIGENLGEIQSLRTW